MQIKIICSTEIKTIIYELYFSLSWLSDIDLARRYKEEIKANEDNFLALIRTKAFEDICGKVVGIRSCFDEYTAIIKQNNE